MQPRFETIPEKKLVGRRLRMSIINNRTPALWRSFMPERKLISHVTSTDLYCVQVFDPTMDFKNFTPNTEYEKWAACEVSDFIDVPSRMETYTIRGGAYAVFLYKG